MLNGIIDMIIENEDTLILADYKTDRINDTDAFVGKYKKQLLLYKKAAEKGIKEAQEALVRRRNSGSASTQVAAQSSGCLLPILVTLTVIVLFVILWIERKN